MATKSDDLTHRADYRLAVRDALVWLYGPRLTMRRNARRELDKLLNSGDTERLVKAAHF